MGLISATDYGKETDHPIYTHWNWSTGKYDWRRTDTVITYNWETDGDGDDVGLQNPESLDTGEWKCENRGTRDSRFAPHGEYVEIWRKSGTREIL